MTRIVPPSAALNRGTGPLPHAVTHTAPSLGGRVGERAGTATASTQPNPSEGVSSDTARLGTSANLDKAGERFEAIFTKMMLSSMRKAKLADSLFESQALDQFRDMQDQKLAENMAAHTPMGIGKAMTEFLAKAGSVAETAPTAPEKGETP